MKRSRLIFSDTVLIVRNYWPFLLSGPVWGVAGAVSLSITGFVEEVKLGGATLCSLMSLWAAVGIIVGNVASNWMVHIRYWIASICGILVDNIDYRLPTDNTLDGTFPNYCRK